MLADISSAVSANPRKVLAGVAAEKSEVDDVTPVEPDAAENAGATTLCSPCMPGLPLWLEATRTDVPLPEAASRPQSPGLLKFSTPPICPAQECITAASPTTADADDRQPSATPVNSASEIQRLMSSAHLHPAATLRPSDVPAKAQPTGIEHPQKQLEEDNLDLKVIPGLECGQPSPPEQLEESAQANFVTGLQNVGGIFKEGWLTKETRGNFLKSCQKRWCVVKDGQLVYFRKKSDKTAAAAIDLNNFVDVNLQSECRRFLLPFDPHLVRLTCALVLWTYRACVPSTPSLPFVLAD